MIRDWKKNQGDLTGFSIHGPSSAEEKIYGKKLFRLIKIVSDSIRFPLLDTSSQLMKHETLAKTRKKTIEHANIQP